MNHDGQRRRGGVPTSWYAHRRDRSWTCDGPSPEALAFHRTLADYAPTPLTELPSLAAELGVGRVLVKDESSRLGLPAFKALGASWALHRALGELHPAWRDEPAAPHVNGRLTVVAATDGNHGRAVARFAGTAGHAVRIFLPDGVSPVAAQAIRDEGAEVIVTTGSYDDAVQAAARAAEEDDALLIQDTSWEGYTDIPGWIVEGYATLFAEVDEQLAAQGAGRPDLVVVPAGVGSLLHAALVHYRRRGAAGGTAVVAAQAQAAACLASSLRAGRPVTVRTGVTVMAGLNCGTPSELAWPYIVHGLDAAVSVPDADAISAVHDLAALAIHAGPCGAAALAAARLALTDPAVDGRAHLGVGPGSTVVLICTEGAAANPLPGASDG